MKGDSRRSISISGVTGGVGLSFADCLPKGCDLTLLVRTTPLGIQKWAHRRKSRIIHGDIRSLVTLARLISSADIYYNFAGISRSTVETSEYANFISTNGFALGVLVKAEADLSLEGRVRIVHPSSYTVCLLRNHENMDWVERAKAEFNAVQSSSRKSVTPDSVNEFAQKFIRFTPPPEGSNIYMLSKLLGEQFLRNVKNATIARVTDVYGPRYDAGGKHIVSRMILHRMNGPGTMSVPDETRDFLYVGDLHEMLRVLGIGKDCLDLVNLGSGRAMALRRVAEFVQQQIPNGKGTFKFTQPTRNDLFVDGRQARILLGRPLMQFEQGLSRTIEYLYRERKSGP